MGPNQLPHDGVCYPFIFVPGALKFSKQITGSGIEFIFVVIYIQCRWQWDRLEGWWCLSFTHHIWKSQGDYKKHIACALLLSTSAIIEADASVENYLVGSGCLPRLSEQRIN